MFNRMGNFNFQGFNRIGSFANIAAAVIKFYVKTKNILALRVRA